MQPAMQLVMLALSLLFPDPAQPRRKFDEEESNGLMQSIQEVGLLQPLIVTKVGDCYKLVAGERRFHALKRLGHERAPCIVVPPGTTEADVKYMQLAENLQRRDLLWTEISRSMKERRDAGDTPTQIGKRLGKELPYVSKYLAPIEKLDAETFALVEKHGLPLTTVYMICSQVETLEERILRVREAINGGLTRAAVARRNRAGVPAREGESRRKRVKVTLLLAGSRMLTVSGPGLDTPATLETAKEAVEVLSRAKREGWELSTVEKVLADKLAGQGREEEGA